jgi:hypothetical protein
MSSYRGTSPSRTFSRAFFIDRRRGAAQPPAPRGRPPSTALVASSSAAGSARGPVRAAARRDRSRASARGADSGVSGTSIRALPAIDAKNPGGAVEDACRPRWNSDRAARAVCRASRRTGHERARSVARCRGRGARSASRRRCAGPGPTWDLLLSEVVDGADAHAGAIGDVVGRQLLGTTASEVEGRPVRMASTVDAARACRGIRRGFSLIFPPCPGTRCGPGECE